MDGSLTKICTRCSTNKPLTDYYRAWGKLSKNPLSGYKAHCKPCVLAQSKEFYKTPQGRKSKLEHAWKSRGFNFTVEQYDELMAKQDKVCAICGVEKNRNGSALCVDHNHKTGQIRGLLCHFCNTALGKFGDDIKMLQKAIQYLEKHGNVKG